MLYFSNEMIKTKKYIRESLSDIYSKMEIDSFVFLILNHVLGLSRKDIILKANEILSQDKVQKISEVVGRLKSYEPIQYILGETEFFGLKFSVKPGILIPRNETEELVDLIIRSHGGRKGKILDIGTGSGCIPIALKKNLTDSEVWSCDISDTALAMAKENALLNRAEVSFMKFDILSGTEFPVFDFDILVSNPPYITEKEKGLMMANVLNYEPHEALFVPDDNPLKFYRAIILQSEKILKREGEVYFEINELYGDATKELLESNNFIAEIIRDINGKDRIVHAKRKS